MQLSDVLKAFNTDPATEKTAAETSKPAATESVKTAASNSLKEALEAAVAAGNQVKTASDKADPVSDLVKLASTLEASETDKLVKEAHAYGEAVADGFIARIMQYDAANTKTASATPAVDQEKLAAAAFEQGFEDATKSIYKVASDCFALGFNATTELIKANK